MSRGLSTLIEDLGLKTTLFHGIDNQASLAVLQDTSSWRTRHLAIRSAVLRDLVKEGIIKASHVRSHEQRADGLTKFLKPDPHKDAVSYWKLKRASEVELTEIPLDTIKEKIKKKEFDENNEVRKIEFEAGEVRGERARTKDEDRGERARST